MACFFIFFSQCIRYFHIYLLVGIFLSSDAIVPSFFSFFCRRGSVVAIFNLKFTRDMADDLGDNVTNNLAVAVKSGSLGGLPVDPASLSVSKVGEWVLLIICLFHTVMNRFSARGTFGTSREGAYSRQGACFFFEKQPNV